MEYIILITRVSVTYADIFHEPKAREMTQNISCVMSMISVLSYTLYMLRILSRALHNNSEILQNISCYVCLVKISRPTRNSRTQPSREEGCQKLLPPKMHFYHFDVRVLRPSQKDCLKRQAVHLFLWPLLEAINLCIAM